MKRILVNQKYVKKNRFMKGNQWEDHWNHRHIKSTVAKVDIPRARIEKAVRLRHHHEMVDCISQENEQNIVQNTKQTAQAADLTLERLLQELKENHIYGMGGAAFDTAMKMETVWNAETQQKVLVVNGVACDPGLLHDRWLLQHHMKEIEMGIEMLIHMMVFNRVILAAKEPYEVGDSSIEMQVVPNRYPMGAEKVLLKAIQGLQYDETKYPAEQGILILNVQTIYALYLAHYEPEQSCYKYITVADLHTGIGAIAKVEIGQSINAVAEMTYGDQLGQNDTIYFGGGILLAEEADQNSVVDEKTAFIGFGEAAHMAEQNRCRGCGACSRKCLMGIEVHKVVQAVEKGKKPPVTKEQAASCLQCGACSYYCKAGKDTMNIISNAFLMHQ